MSDQRRFTELGRDFLVYGLLLAVSRSVELLLLPVFTRIFSQSQFGSLDVLAALSGMVTLLVRLSLPSAIFRYFHEYEGEERARLVSSVMAFSLAFGTIVAAAGWFLADPVVEKLLRAPGQATAFRVALLAAYAAIPSGLAQTVLRMERRVVAYNLLDILYTVIYCAAALGLVFGYRREPLSVFWAMLVAESARSALALWFARKHLARSLSRPILARSLRFSLPLFPAVLITWVNNQTDRFVILGVLSVSAVSVYAAATRIRMIMGLFAQVFARAWGPIAMTMIHAGEEEATRFFNRALWVALGGFFAAGSLLVSVSPEIFRLVVPPEYSRGYLLLPWLVGASIVHMAAQVTNVGVVLSEKSYANSFAALVAAALNVVLTLALVLSFGIVGSALGTFLAEIVFASGLLYGTLRTSLIRLKPSFLLLPVALYALHSAGFLVVVHWAGDAASSAALRLLWLSIWCWAYLAATRRALRVKKLSPVAFDIARSVVGMSRGS